MWRWGIQGLLIQADAAAFVMSSWTHPNVSLFFNNEKDRSHLRTIMEIVATLWTLWRDLEIPRSLRTLPRLQELDHTENCCPRECAALVLQAPSRTMCMRGWEEGTRSGRRAWWGGWFWNADSSVFWPGWGRVFCNMWICPFVCIYFSMPLLLKSVIPSVLLALLTSG